MDKQSIQLPDLNDQVFQASQNATEPPESLFKYDSEICQDDGSVITQTINLNDLDKIAQDL